MDVAIPKLRAGSSFPDCLLERQRAERALTTVVATCYLLGVTTPPDGEARRNTLGITRLSKSRVSVMARELDEHVADCRSRPLCAGPYTFVAAEPGVEGPRRRSGRQRARVGTHRRQRRPASGDPGPAGHLSQRRRRPTHVLPGPHRTRPVRGSPLVTNDVYQGLVAAIGAEAQSVMAVLQDAIRRGPDGHHPEIQLAFAGLVQPNDVGSQV